MEWTSSNNYCLVSTTHNTRCVDIEVEFSLTTLFSYCLTLRSNLGFVWRTKFSSEEKTPPTPTGTRIANESTSVAKTWL